LHGFKSLWRIRVGDYRVVYTVNDPAKTVDVTRIGHRLEVYD
jgi:mRNA interferase RelE/StbE